MSKIEYVFAGTDPVLQSSAADMLCRCFDEWQMFRAQYGERFPFEEISFLARADGRIAGHVGVMEFPVQDGSGGTLRMAGVASVGVAPEYRGRGIARELCTLAAKWAAQNGFAALPLYTGVPQVYARCGWQTVPSNGVTLQPPDTAAAASGEWRSGNTLTDAEKDRIIKCYEALPPLPGRVVRDIAGPRFHSWEWLFAGELNRFLVTRDGYALAVDGVLAEIGGDETALARRCTGIAGAFLSPRDRAAEALRAMGWREAQGSPDAPECWHGEGAMLKLLPGRTVPDDLFFPLADKF